MLRIMKAEVSLLSPQQASVSAEVIERWIAGEGRIGVRKLNIFNSEITYLIICFTPGISPLIINDGLKKLSVRGCFSSSERQGIEVGKCSTPSWTSRDNIIRAPERFCMAGMPTSDDEGSQLGGAGSTVQRTVAGSLVLRVTSHSWHNSQRRCIRQDSKHRYSGFNVKIGGERV
ncbi:hypothetical protein PM082_009458 [Marasmius tenuissimus]|nr:hypothetical protein PM082_009458 [Marasmius tenuissimus]